MRQVLTTFLRSRLNKLVDTKVSSICWNRPGAGLAGMYLSVLGTSAEDADCGEVGRANQANDIFAVNRLRGSEVAPGKSPVSHVGKIYNVLAHCG